MAKKSIRKKLKDKLDTLWRKAEGVTYCEICNSLPREQRVNYTQLHSHHIIPRTHRATRFSLENRIFLCPSHHSLGGYSAHNHPVWFTEWLKKNKPDTYRWVLDHQFENKKWTLDELENIIKELEEIK